MTVPEQHQLKIARSTLKMSDAGAAIMGGMNKAEAALVIYRLTGRANPEYAAEQTAKRELETARAAYAGEELKDLEDPF